uniref:Pancreatic trypsin inhibitor n=1 Tax=Sus scrofa TaxID=9823 RepID=A0A8D1V949_PIG
VSTSSILIIIILMSQDLDNEKCPSNRARCEMKERDQCTKHRQCPNKMNCCKFACGKKCLNIKQDVCSLPKKTGPCLAYLPRWWYDKEKKVCSRFIYGGCQGNNNNFQSENVCKDICSQKSKIEPASSWIQVRFIATESQWELLESAFLTRTAK